MIRTSGWLDGIMWRVYWPELTERLRLVYQPVAPS